MGTVNIPPMKNGGDLGDGFCKCRGWFVTCGWMIYVWCRYVCIYIYLCVCNNISWWYGLCQHPRTRSLSFTHGHRNYTPHTRDLVNKAEPNDGSFCHEMTQSYHTIFAYIYIYHDIYLSLSLIICICIYIYMYIMCVCDIALFWFIIKK